MIPDDPEHDRVIDPEDCPPELERVLPLPDALPPRKAPIMPSFAKPTKATVIPCLRYRDGPADIEWLCLRVPATVLSF